MTIPNYNLDSRFLPQSDSLKKKKEEKKEPLYRRLSFIQPFKNNFCPPFTVSAHFLLRLFFRWTKTLQFSLSLSFSLHYTTFNIRSFSLSLSLSIPIIFSWTSFKVFDCVKKEKKKKGTLTAYSERSWRIWLWNCDVCQCQRCLAGSQCQWRNTTPVKASLLITCKPFLGYGRWLLINNGYIVSQKISPLCLD